MYKLGGLLRAVPFFKDADLQFLQELVTHLQFEVYLQGDIIIKGGTRGNRMFFIEHGTVEVVFATGDVAATLGKGSHFGGLLPFKSALFLAYVILRMFLHYRVSSVSLQLELSLSLATSSR